MLVTGTLANSAVSVASGATLGGEGRVGPTVTVSGSGKIAPGAAHSSQSAGTTSVLRKRLG